MPIRAFDSSQIYPLPHPSTWADLNPDNLDQRWAPALRNVNRELNRIAVGGHPAHFGSTGSVQE